MGSSTREERLAVLQLELQLLQSRFDKHDDLIFRSRGWLIAIITGLAGWSISQEEPLLSLLAVAVSIAMFVAEVVWRSSDLAKYVARYRSIRQFLNAGGRDILNFPVYDLSNSLMGLPPYRERLSSALLKPEVLVFYSATSLLGICIYIIVLETMQQ